jgi:hypothetical protein
MKSDRRNEKAISSNTPKESNEERKVVIQEPSNVSDSSDITQFDFSSSGTEIGIPDEENNDNISEPGTPDIAHSVLGGQDNGMSDLAPSMPKYTPSDTELGEIPVVYHFNAELGEIPANRI